MDYTQFQRTSEIVEYLTKNKTPAERGPFSHSRLENTCGFWFNEGYIKRSTDGLDLSQYGTNFGSAQHEVNELDVEMRIHKDSEEWESVEDLVSEYLEQNEEFVEFHQELVEQTHMFRFNFEINPDLYVGSEESLGAYFDMTPVDYEGPNCWYRGKIDYLEIDASEGLARVVDFKNYPSIHSEAAINNTSYGVGCQLMGYLALVMAMYPHVYQGVYEVYYTRFGCSRTSSKKDEYGQWVKRYISREEVERWWKFNQLRMLARERKTDFSPNPSHFNCKYCPWVKKCPWYESKGENEFLAVDQDKAIDMVNRLVLIKQEESRIKHALDEFGEEVTSDGGDMYGYTEYERISVDPKVFLAVCKKAGVDAAKYVTINKTNLQKVRDGLQDEQLKEQLEDAITVTTHTRKVTPK